MCGIGGAVGVRDPDAIGVMGPRLAHRGPDDAGVWVSRADGVALVHRRLAIIDLSPAGHQPMVNDSGDLVLVFNGEIYDYARHRASLEGEGVRFRGRSDTEVLLRLYERYGTGCLERVNGMFAFAIWDARRRSLVLARDHAGIKPLYYAEGAGGAFYFASEIKALLAVPEVPAELNSAAIADFLTFLWVPGEQTMLRGIKKLHPGHYLEWQGGQATVRPWFRLAYRPDPVRREDDWAEEVAATVTAAVRRQMVADVPLGAFLSGGLDSSAIVAAMRDAYPERQIRAYTARVPADAMGREQGDDDYPYAVEVARQKNVDLRVIDIDASMMSLLPHLIYHLDEPDADPAIVPAYLIAKRAREEGTTVLMSGTGGDEVFCGYRSHRAYGLYARADGDLGSMLRPIGELLARGSALVLGHRHRVSRRLAKLVRGLRALPGVDRHLALVDWSSPGTRAALLRGGPAPADGAAGRAALEYYARLFEGEGSQNLHSHLLVNTFLAAHNFLYGDKTSMASSIEVRVPLVDLEVMRLGARIPEELKLHGGTTKYIFKRAMERLLPRNVIYRPKVGFGMPLRAWLRTDPDSLVSRVLQDSAVRRRGIFDADAVAQVLRDNTADHEDHAYLVFALLYFEVWLQTFVDRRGVEVTW